MKSKRHWAEISALVLLVLAYALVISSSWNKEILLTLSALSGLAFGRVWYRCRKQLKLPWVLMIAGFFTGMITAAATIGMAAGSIAGVAIFFLGSLWGSYYVHRKGIIKSSEY